MVEGAGAGVAGAEVGRGDGQEEIDEEAEAEGDDEGAAEGEESGEVGDEGAGGNDEGDAGDEDLPSAEGALEVGGRGGVVHSIWCLCSPDRRKSGPYIVRLRAYGVLFRATGLRHGGFYLIMLLYLQALKLLSARYAF